MMTDREKAFRGLELCAYDPDPGQTLKEVRSCPECPYYLAGCSTRLICDALTLLKEQGEDVEQGEGVAPIESTTEQKMFADRIGFAVSEFWCGACHFNLFNRFKYCPNCGKKVKWDV